ncbi:MAG: M23 family metallopeptidase [Pseudomonadota bacterium]
MKSDVDRRLMRLPLLTKRLQPAMSGIAISLLFMASLSACTTYRSLDQGASVPWAKALTAERGGPLEDGRYRVSSGDALSTIADRYGVRLASLATANNIQPPYILYPGEVLRIPEEIPVPARRPQIIQTALPPAGEAAPNETQAWKREAAPAGERYVVKTGESLALIAVRRGLTLGDLVATNDLKPPYTIKPGQVLIIPPKENAWKRSGRTETSETASSMPPPPPLSSEGFIWPVAGDLVGSFEQNSEKGRSGGVTIAARRGAAVRAADSGIVAYAGEALSGYGRMVMLRHAEGYVTLYAHNDAILVKEGDVVRRGEPIAEVGSSGDVSQSQLHFEIRKGKAPVDPARILAGLPG